ncbi:hypothetical protein [Fuscibacter oryzae]|uniref:Uncharacterized protein n=1 Tax=Fuscibacter oryzae TaxID=2803939 RepID=A0A8J7SVR4_9RHOB|nr:hypothetical protein [Fuscibacter oryzae]MBL4929792.1 hypothetical protein [Fuscibacter oryzae]
MLQRFENTRPYSPPLSPILVSGERFALPADFVDGLAFLRPLLPRKGDWFDMQISVLGRKLYPLMNELVVEYDAGTLDLPDWRFNPEVIPILETFGAPPMEVFVQRNDLHLRWHDGQELVARPVQSFMSGSTYQRMADQEFSHFRSFDQGIVITDDTRSGLRKLIEHKRLAKDIFITGS